MPLLYTVGHSTRAWEEFVELLRAHGVRQLADVRRFPGSRRHPHFNAEHLAGELPKAGIAYLPFVALGGRRKPRADSPNGGWHNEAFRGYADYTMTRAFKNALAELEREAARHVTAIMCAETLPWRCHRSLIANALLARGWDVRDIMSATSAKVHGLPPFARVVGGEVTYPPPEDLFDAPG